MWYYAGWGLSVASIEDGVRYDFDGVAIFIVVVLMVWVGRLSVLLVGYMNDEVRYGFAEDARINSIMH